MKIELRILRNGFRKSKKNILLINIIIFLKKDNTPVTTDNKKVEKLDDPLKKIKKDCQKYAKKRLRSTEELLVRTEEEIAEEKGYYEIDAKCLYN